MTSGPLKIQMVPLGEKTVALLGFLETVRRLEAVAATDQMTLSLLRLKSERQTKDRLCETRSSQLDFRLRVAIGERNRFCSSSCFFGMLVAILFE